MKLVNLFCEHDPAAFPSLDLATQLVQKTLFVRIVQHVSYSKAQ